MKIIVLKIVITGIYFFMIYMNYLANSKPLNNRNTGQISDDYPSLFTPSGYAFSIWGIIYLLLGVFVFKTLFTQSSLLTDTYVSTVMILFIVTSVFNIAWLLLWHYDYIVLSSLVMLFFLIANILTVNLIPSTDVLLKTTFSIYAAWIMVAFIANISIMLVKLDIPIFANNETLWYVIVMTVGLSLASLLLFLDHNVVYSLVFLWAFLAIFLKHQAKVGHHLTSNAPIYYTAIIIVIVVILSLWTFINNGYKVFL